MSETPEENEAKDDVKQQDLPANLNKLYLKAESAMELRNWSYAVSLIQAILTKEPGFLDGRKRLRLAAVKQGSHLKQKFITSSDNVNTYLRFTTANLASQNTQAVTARLRGWRATG